MYITSEPKMLGLMAVLVILAWVLAMLLQFLSWQSSVCNQVGSGDGMN